MYLYITRIFGGEEKKEKMADALKIAEGKKKLEALKAKKKAAAASLLERSDAAAADNQNAGTDGLLAFAQT